MTDLVYFRTAFYIWALSEWREGKPLRMTREDWDQVDWKVQRDLRTDALLRVSGPDCTVRYYHNGQPVAFSDDDPNLQKYL